MVPSIVDHLGAVAETTHRAGDRVAVVENAAVALVRATVDLGVDTMTAP